MYYLLLYYLLLSMLKTGLVIKKKKNWWLDSSKEQRLFEIEKMSNIIKVFTATFDQFNAYWLNKRINKKKNLTDLGCAFQKHRKPKLIIAPLMKIVLQSTWSKDLTVYYN